MRSMKKIQEVPFFPLIPLLPMAIVVSSFVLSIRAMVRVRRLEQRMAAATIA